MFTKFNDATKFDNLRDLLANSVKLYQNNDAFILKEKDDKNNVKYKHITYKDFQNDINWLGTVFMEMGFHKKRIAVIGKNCYKWAVTYLATLNGVGVVVPLDNGLPLNEIESSLKRSKADVVVFAKNHLDNMKIIFNNKSTDVKEFICMDSTDVPEFKCFDKILNKGKKLFKNGNTSFLDTDIDSHALASLIFTSGTTASSKAVMLSHDNIASNIYDMLLVENFYDTDVNMAFLPFHHTFGSTGLLVFLSVGATNVFCDGLRHIQENLNEYHVSVFVCVPLLLEAMYKQIMKQIQKQGKENLIKNATKVSKFLLKCHIDIRRKLFKQIIDNLGGKLRLVISGASSLDKTVAEAFNNFGIITIQGYGLTETSPVLSAENPDNIKFGSIGFPMPSVKMKIYEPNESGIGEIIAKGPNVMLGYYENETATNEVIVDGWFHTGDLGYQDEDGYFFVTGRKKNVIVLKNGKNIYPEELESLITKLDYVSEVMVFGLPKDDDLLLSTKIVYNKDVIDDRYPNISQEELKSIIWKDIKEINSGLTNYKHIKNLIITDEPMIKTTTAKIKRFEEMKKLNNK